MGAEVKVDRAGGRLRPFQIRFAPRNSICASGLKICDCAALGNWPEEDCARGCKVSEDVFVPNARAIVDRYSAKARSVTFRHEKGRSRTRSLK